MSQRWYTWAEICEKQVPRLNDFLAVRNQVLRALRRADPITAVAVIGSAVTDPTVRSDINLCIVCDRAHLAAVRATLEEIKLFARKRGMRVTFDILLAEALTPEGPYEMRLLQRACDEGGAVRGCVLSYVQPSGEPLKAQVKRYLERQLGYFREQQASNLVLNDQVVVCERVIQTVWTAARMVLLLRDIPVRTRKEVRECYRADGDPLEEIFVRLLRIDVAYEEALPTFLRTNSVNGVAGAQHEYTDLVATSAQALLDGVLPFLEGNLTLVR